MHELVRQVLEREKRDFLIRHEIYEIVYCPYMLKIQGTNETGRLMQFELKSNNLYSVGDTVKVTNSNNEIDNVKIQTINYAYAQDYHDYNGDYEYTSNFPDSKRFYHKETGSISDEEYMTLKAALPEVPIKKARPPVETIMDTMIFIIAVLIGIAGIITGLVVGGSYRGNATIGWVIAVVSVIHMFILLGFGTIINLLTRIANRL